MGSAIQYIYRYWLEEIICFPKHVIVSCCACGMKDSRVLSLFFHKYIIPRSVLITLFYSQLSYLILSKIFNIPFIKEGIVGRHYYS